MKNFKKVLSIVLSLVVILSALAGTITVSAASNSKDESLTDLLLENTSGRIYGVPFSLTNEQDYTPDYSTLNYSELIDMNAYWNRFGSDIVSGGSVSDMDDPSLAYLTDGDSDEVVHLRDASDSIVSSTGKYIIETHRMAVAYDLGAFCNLESLRLELDGNPEKNILRNFSVYAGDKLDGSIFNNRIAVGGTDSAATTELSVITEANFVKYIVIVFDHLTTYYSAQVNRYGYDVYLKQINLYGEKVTDILLGNTTGRVYGVPFSLTQAQEYTPDYATLQYTDLVDLRGTWYRYGTDFYGDNIFEDPSLANVTDGDSDETVTLQDASDNTKEDGKLVIEKYRMAVAYDLGGLYNLDAFVMQLDSSKSYIVRNFSVYAGEKLDGSIFNNRIAIGGSNAVVDNISVTAKANAVRYFVIVFDHITASNQSIVNCYGSYVYAKQFNLYGKKLENIVAGEKVKGNIYNITLDEPYTHTADGVIDVWTKRDYTNFAPCAMSADYIFSIADENGKLVSTNSLGISNEQVLKNLATGEGESFYEVSHTSGGLVVPNEHRVAIGYDLGGWYNLNRLVLNQELTKGIIQNFSVYAGNTFDASIFNNCVGEYVGGKETAIADLGSLDAVRYIMIVLDHVSVSHMPTLTNAYGYYARLTGIEVYGVETEKPVYEYGDINCDNDRNVLDFIALAKGIESGKLGISVADLNYDGLVDSNDLVVLRKVLLGVEVVNTLKYSDYYTLRNGLTNTYDKIKNGEDITIAFMGGSITYGIGTDGLANSFRNLTENWLEQQYGIGVEQYNVAIPSACSAVGAFAVYDDVLVHNPDLVFVEYAINDKYAKALYTPDEISANIETVIRKIRINNPNCDIVLLYTTDSNVSYTEPFFTESALHEAVAEHYGVMSVNIGHALRRTKGLESYSTPTWKDYFMDGCHTSNGGNKVYADVIKEAILSAFRADEDTLTSVSLPAQKSGNLNMNSTYIKTANVTLEGSAGWKKASGQWDVFTQYPDGYIYTDTANNELVYTFSGTSFSLLGFINRTLTYSLDGGEWQSFSKFNSHPQPLVKGLENCEHTIRIKIDNANNEKISVSAFLIGQPQTDADAYNTEYVELREGLNNTYYKLSTEKELKVAYIGGSITAGAGASNPAATSYRALITAWLKEEFPDATITEINRGIGSTGSLLPTFYVDDFVANEAPDLVFLEMAVNDYLEHRTEGAVSVQYETIIRKLLAANPKCEFVSLYTINDVISLDEEYYTQAKAQYDVAVHYGIPSANIGRKLRIDKGLLTPKVDGVYTSDWKTYFGDEVHPSDAGHREYADTIEYLLSSAFAIAENTDNGIADKVLPEQKNSNLLMNTSLVLAKDLDLTNSTGWQVAESTKGAGLGVNESLIASTQENELTFKFTGTNLYFYCTPVPFDGTAPLYTISVDGGEWQQVGPGGANPLTVLEGLGAGEHTLRFIAGGVGDNAKSDTYKTFTLAAILYY